MGEIKSTLDLVMEKTRHLTASDEEKKAQKKEEIKKQIKGLLLKYQDNLVKMEDIKDTLADLRTSHGNTADRVFKKELVNGIDMDGDNAKLIELLRNLCGADIKRLDKLLLDYKNSLLDSAAEAVIKIRDNLSQQHLISGSAVVPNLEKDAEWIGSAGEIRQKFEEKILKEKEKLIGR